MKQIGSFLSIILGCIILLCIQICLLRYEHSLNPNLLLIAYTYSVFAPLSVGVIAFTIFLLDIFNFLITGYFGFTILWLTICSLTYFKIKHNFYNKLILPIANIMVYQLFLSILLYVFIQQSLSITLFLKYCLQDSMLCVLVWWITQQPWHD
ncbi:hypothetical protein KBD08_03075 [Candidatus Babeliales bacterium]|nr:hypothetical protein [Candidatus Babeliales bacterium]